MIITITIIPREYADSIQMLITGGTITTLITPIFTGIPIRLPIGESVSTWVTIGGGRHPTIAHIIITTVITAAVLAMAGAGTVHTTGEEVTVMGIITDIIMDITMDTMMVIWLAITTITMTETAPTTMVTETAQEQQTVLQEGIAGKGLTEAVTTITTVSAQ